ncbi:MAG: hypothetical protein ACE5JS_12310 [Nitrospinota bacterium]
MRMTEGDRRRAQSLIYYFQVSTLSCLFIILVLLAISFRDPRFFVRILNAYPAVNSEFTEVAGLCGDLPMCFRVTSAWIGYALQQFSFALGGALNLKATTLPWLGVSLEAKRAFLSLAVAVLYRMIVLLPILLVAFLSFRKFVTRLLFLLIAFLAISGWTPFESSFVKLAMDLYGWGGTRFAAEELVTFLFGSYVIYYDYYAIGFLFLLYLYLTRVEFKRFRHVACLLLIGQTGFEHLGLITGVAVVLYSILTDSDRPMLTRLKSGARSLAGYGAISVAAMVALFGLLNVTSEEVFWGGPGESFSVLYEAFGRQNLAQLRTLILKMGALLTPPLLAGILLGAFSALLGEGDRSALRAELAAAAAICVGFLASVCVGLFVSGLHQEMGRQLLPLASLAVMLAAKGVAYIVAMAGRRNAEA